MNNMENETNIKAPDLNTQSTGTEEEKNYTDPEIYGISKDQTVGLSTSPTILNNIISMISLPKGEKKGSEFPRIVLNFDKEGGSLWWGNEQKGVFFKNFGFVSDTFFDQLWGNGTIAFSAAKLLKNINYLRNFKEIIFWANPKTNIFAVQAGDVDIFTEYLDSPDEITTSMNKGADKTKKNSMVNFPIGLDSEYIPVMKESYKENALIYGADIDVEFLREIIARAQDKYASLGFYPFEISKDGILISFNDLLNPKDTGANKKKLVPKLNSLKVPEDEFKIRHVLGSILEGPAKNISGDVTIRFAGSKKAPVYLLKKEKKESGGILVSGFILGAVDDSGKGGKK